MGRIKRGGTEQTAHNQTVEEYEMACTARQYQGVEYILEITSMGTSVQYYDQTTTDPPLQPLRHQDVLYTAQACPHFWSGLSIARGWFSVYSPFFRGRNMGKYL